MKKLGNLKSKISENRLAVSGVLIISGLQIT